MMIEVCKVSSTELVKTEIKTLTFPSRMSETRIYFLKASNMMCETARAGVVMQTRKKYCALS